VLEFDSSFGGGELPVGLGVVGIAVVLPGSDFVDEGLFVGNAAVEALAAREALAETATPHLRTLMLTGAREMQEAEVLPEEEEAQKPSYCRRKWCRVGCDPWLGWRRWGRRSQKCRGCSRHARPHRHHLHARPNTNTL
jgi:hypothetical protein